MTETSSEAAERHMATYRAAYDRVNPSAEEWFKVWWAGRVADSVQLQYATSPNGPIVAGRFEPADYTDDGLRPEGKTR